MLKSKDQVKKVDKLLIRGIGKKKKKKRTNKQKHIYITKTVRIHMNKSAINICSK